MKSRLIDWFWNARLPLIQASFLPSKAGQIPNRPHGAGASRPRGFRPFTAETVHWTVSETPLTPIGSGAVLPISHFA